MSARRWATFLAVILVAPALGASASASGQSSGGKSLTTIKWAVPALSGSWAPVAYGYYQGIFKKYGIDLKMNFNGGASVSGVQLLANNTTNIGFSAPTTMMTEYKAGVKTEAVLGFMQSNPSGITMRKSVGVTKPKQLIGKTIGVGTGTSTIGQLNAYLAHYGIKQNQVRIIQTGVGSLPAEVSAGRLDGMAGFPYSLEPELNALGVKTNDLYFTQAGLAEIDGQWAMGTAWVNSHQQQVRALVTAMLKSEEGAIAHPNAAVKDLIKTNPQTAPPFGVALKQWTGTIPTMWTRNDVCHPLGWQSPKDWATTLKFGERLLQVPAVKTSALFTNRFIPAKTPVVGKDGKLTSHC